MWFSIRSSKYINRSPNEYNNYCVVLYVQYVLDDHNYK